MEIGRKGTRRGNWSHTQKKKRPTISLRPHGRNVDKCKHAANMFAKAICGVVWCGAKRTSAKNINIKLLHNVHRASKWTAATHGRATQSKRYIWQSVHYAGITVPVFKQNVWRHKVIIRIGHSSSLHCYYFHAFAVNNVVGNVTVKMYDTLNIVCRAVNTSILCGCFFFTHSLSLSFSSFPTIRLNISAPNEYATTWFVRLWLR